MSDEFYIGYAQHAPAGLSRFVSRAIAAVAVVSTAVCAALLLLQSRFPAKLFEYGVSRQFAGVIINAPYPSLVSQDGASYLLVAPGKHGFDTRDLAGMPVSLQGTLIQFGPNRMLEVASALRAQSLTPVHISSSTEVIGPVRLQGEIVDTKCYFGVMQPGQGKVHRSCAARCLSGGIPPGLLFHDPDGSSRVVLLARADGTRVNGSSLVRLVGEPVTLSGTLVRTAAGVVLQTSF